ncbi:MAG: ribulose-phosphate 3-epimerase [Gaiellaceae bacterium]
MSELSVGVLTADLLRLGDDLDAVARAGVTQLHVDVIDGVFCPGLTVGAGFVKALPDRFRKDVHLMVVEPVDKVAAFVDAGADAITVHVESTRHVHRVLQELGGAGVTRGVAVNPGTPIAAVEPLLQDLELLLVLGVNPGWPGQQLVPATFARLVAARELIDGRPIVLAVDGGITRENVAVVASCGVDLIVTGSAVFDGVAPEENARFMLEAARSAGNQSAALAGAGPKEER